MRKRAVLFAAVLLVLAVGEAGASPNPPKGTLDLDLGPLPTLQFRADAMDVSWRYADDFNHLSWLRFYGPTWGAITGSGTVPVTDPETTGTVKSIRVSVTLGAGTLTGISGAPPLGRNELPLQGFARVCLFSQSCRENLPVNLTLNDGNTGVGVGGLMTFGEVGAFRRISIENAPWTLGTATGINQTAGGGFKTLSAAGFVHSLASATNSTITNCHNSVMIQLIAPQQVTTWGIAGNNDVLTLFPTLTIRLPEPGLLLLLGSGVVGLGVLGRRRMKQ